MRWVIKFPQLAGVLSIAVAVTVAPYLAANLTSANVLHHFTDDAVAAVAHYSDADQSDFDSQQKLVGALLTQHGAVEAGARLLGRYTQQNERPGASTRYLLGQALYANGQLAEAGLAFQAAGLYDRLAFLKQSRALNAVYTDAQLAAFTSSAVAAANRALAEGDARITFELAMHARSIGGDDPTFISESYFLQARASQELGELGGAISYARQSLDIVPPEDVEDKRYRLIFDAAAHLTVQEGCQVNAENRLRALLLIYVVDRLPKSFDTCVTSLAAQMLSDASSLENAFVLRRQAAIQLEQGKLAQAEQLLDQAIARGLPPVWKAAMLVQTPGMMQPTYLVSDERLAGYEIDPFEVELGLPLDLILFYRANGEGLDIKRVTAINLAPNAGFEYQAPERCDLTDCQPLGFETDIYNNMTRADRRVFTDVVRPLMPNATTSMIVSQALTLNSRTGSDVLQSEASASMSSFRRSVKVGARYLQACWFKSNGGNGFVGRHWWGSNRTPPYDYLASEFKNPAWVYKSQVVQPPPDATGLQLWLIDFKSRGTSWFDGSLLVKLP